MSWDLLEAETFAERDTSSLKSVGGGGAPMPPELVKRIEENFSQGRPGLGYGMTETNAYGPQNAGDDFVGSPTSTGRVVPVMDLRVTDPEGYELPTGETGEIWFRGPMLIRGYWNRPDAAAETIVDGWLRTGDIGRLDDEGFVYVSDRAKDMVLRGGEKGASRFRRFSRSFPNRSPATPLARFSNASYAIRSAEHPLEPTSAAPPVLSGADAAVLGSDVAEHLLDVRATPGP